MADCELVKKNGESYCLKCRLPQCVEDKVETRQSKLERQLAKAKLDK